MSERRVKKRLVTNFRLMSCNSHPNWSMMIGWQLEDKKKCQKFMRNKRNLCTDCKRTHAHFTRKINRYDDRSDMLIIDANIEWKSIHLLMCFHQRTMNANPFDIDLIPLMTSFSFRLFVPSMPFSFHMPKCQKKKTHEEVEKKFIITNKPKKRKKSFGVAASVTSI